MPEVRKKETICATVSPYIVEKVEKYVKSGRFSSKSDLVSVAISELISRLEAEERLRSHLPPTERSAQEELQRLVESGELEEGDEVLVDDATGEVKIRKKR